MEHFDIYKNQKKTLSLVYKGISVERVLALDIWSLNDRKKKRIKTLGRFFCYMDFSFITDVNKKGLFTIAAKAKNHIELFNSMESKISSEYKAVYLNEVLRKILFINIKNIFNSIRFVFSHLKNQDVSMMGKLALSASYCHVMNTIDFLMKLENKRIYKYLAYSSAHYWENLLCQYFKTKSVPTYSLQHGTNFLFKKNIPVDCINYENLECDHYLCWGEYTKDELQRFGIDLKRLYVAGYPHDISVREFDTNNTFKTCLLLLSRAIYDTANKKLLSMLEKNRGVVFYIKLHPTLNHDYYETFCNSHSNFILVENQTLYQCVENSNFDFSIVVNSTAYYETLLMGIPTFRFSHESFDNFWGYLDLFDDIKTLESLIDKISMQVHNGDYAYKISQMLKYAIGMGVDNYKKILLAEN